MNITSILKRDEDKVIVSTYIPRYIAGYISLYALIKGVPKSTIIKDQLENFVEVKQAEGDSKKQLIEALVKRASNHFKELKEINKKTPIEGFLNKLKKELEKTIVDKKEIYQILQKIKDETNR